MANIDSYFVERINQFHKNVYQKVLRANPYQSVVPMSAFDLNEGRTPTVRTLTHELPTSYPTAMTKVQVSNGTGDPYCDPAATTVKRGEIQRTFDLYQAAFDTDTLCVSDMKRAEQAAAAVAGWEKGLTEYLKVFWSDYARVKNVSMVDNKATTDSATSLSSVINQDADFTGVGAIPTQHLNWDHLNQLYWELVRTAGEEAAIGSTSDGKLVFPLFAGPGIIKRLFKDDDVRQEVRYFDPKSNLKILGYNGSINGFMPVVDIYALRFGDVADVDGEGDGVDAVSELTVANLIYPHVNDNATVGRKHSFNSQFRTVARGGIAQYEVATVLGPQVYENKFEAINPSTFSKAGFSQPSSYIGEFDWINNKTFRGDNDRGNHGYYRADVRVASKPIYPENGWSILTLATDI
jgi:hypothetical protein